MTTTGSYFRKHTRLASLYRVSLKSLSPMMVVFGILFFLAMPFVYITFFINNGYPFEPEQSSFGMGIYFAGEAHSVIIYIIAAFMAVLLALFTNSYMHGKKNIDVYHAIPATRTELLGSNFLASMTAIAAPLLGNYILTILIESAMYFGRPLIMPLYHLHNIQDFAFALVYAAIAYLFVSFICVNVGTTFDTFAISMALGFSVLIVYALCGNIWASYTYGARFNPGMGMLLLSPFTFIFYKHEFIASNGSSAWDNMGWLLLFMLCSLVLTAGLFALTAYRYRKRKSEIAEQAQTGGAFQTAVKVLASFLGAAMVLAVTDQASLSGKIFSILIGALLVGVVAELVLSRGVKSLKKNVLWLAGTGLVCCVLIAMVDFDVAGYESYVPAESEIESVSVNSAGRFAQLTTGHGYYNSYGLVTLTSSESIAVVRDAHESMTEHKPPEADRDYSLYPYIGVNIEYKLKNGSTVSRYYDWGWYESSSVLTQLEDKDDYIAQSAPVFTMDTGEMRERMRPVGVSYSDSFRSFTQGMNLSEANTRRLIDAVKADMLNETLDEIYNPTQPALGYLTISYAPVERDGRMGFDMEMVNTYTGGTDASVLVTYEYVNTIALLQEWGVYESMTNVPAPDSVYISYADSYSNDSVRVLSPNERRSDLYQNVYRYISSDGTVTDGILAMTDDSGEVERILSAAANQMLVCDRHLYSKRNETLEEFYENAHFYAIFCRGNTVTGEKMIRYSDLPDSLKRDIREYYNSPQEVYYK